MKKSSKQEKRLKVNKVDAFIAEYVMGEPRPRTQESPFETFTRGPKPSPKKNWFAHHVFEHGDVTEWIPASFSTDTNHAMRALQKFCKDEQVKYGIEGDAQRVFCYFANDFKEVSAMKYGRSFADAVTKAITHVKKRQGRAYS